MPIVRDPMDEELAAVAEFKKIVREFFEILFVVAAAGVVVYYYKHLPALSNYFFNSHH